MRWVLLPLLIVGCVLLGGCSTEGMALMTSPATFGSDLWYVLRWCLAGLLILIALGTIFFAFESSAGAGILTCGVVALVFWVLDPYIDPGTVPPHTVQYRAEAEALRERQLELRREEEHAAARRTPEYQLDRTNKALVGLRARVKDELTPLRTGYRKELKGYLSELRRDLPRAGLASHEELLRTKNEHLALYNTLQRAAKLWHMIDWLEDKTKESEIAVLQLDQKRWDLEKLIEMKEIATEEELGAIQKIVTSAEVMLEESLSPPARQDIALLEAAVFAEALGR